LIERRKQNVSNLNMVVYDIAQMRYAEDLRNAERRRIASEHRAEMQRQRPERRARRFGFPRVRVSRPSEA
jgi:hypothetical protein